jgi:hypothetical protein
VIYGITEDDQGRLWMACSKGIFSVSRTDLRQFADGKIPELCQHALSPLDGLRTVECQPGDSRRSREPRTAACGFPPSAASS